jgi:hypothetical protein
VQLDLFEARLDMNNSIENEKVRTQYVLLSKEDNTQLKNLLEASDYFAAEEKEKLLVYIISHIPAILKKIALWEIEKGNFVGQIAIGSWPNNGSTSIGLVNPFKIDFSSIDLPVRYSKPEDIRYCYEEVALLDNNVEHLICSNFPEDYLKTKKKPKLRR